MKFKKNKINTPPWLKSAVAAALATALIVGALPAARAEMSREEGNHSFEAQLKSKVKHVIVIYQENWSFDALYGRFPGVNGFANGFDTLAQWDRTSAYMSYLYQMPQPLNGGADLRFPPANGQPALPMIPYDLTKYVADTNVTGDIVHKFYHEQLQIDNGLLEPSLGSMDKFVTWSDNPGLVLSYFDATGLPEGKLAQQYTICDNFFHSAYGGSFLNHQFLVAAASPLWEQAIPAGFQSSYDPGTRSLNDSHLTMDGRYCVNTTFGLLAPHPASVPLNQLMLPINNVDAAQSDYTPTIGNRLDDAGIRWKWYSGGWNNALNGHADPLFQYHHQAFAYYAKYAPFNPDGTLNPATTGPAAHLQDEQVFWSDVTNGTLPSVCFIKPLGPDNEHPGYAALRQGQQHVADLVSAIQHSPYWKDSVIIITYDENGGRWDHVTPPIVDQWGVGTRVPAIIVSRFTQGGYVDRRQNETVSILKLIERRFNLAPLSARDANPAVNDLSEVFHFSSDRAADRD